MEKRIGQILGGTRYDAQGEKLPKDFFDRLCRDYRNKKLPLHQHHDMAKNTVGYIENLRVEKDYENCGEWSLVGDVYSEVGAINELIRGFSISGVIPLNSRS